METADLEAKKKTKEKRRRQQPLLLVAAEAVAQIFRRLLHPKQKRFMSSCLNRKKLLFHPKMRECLVMLQTKS
jgi:hypothetical protein